MGVKHQTIVLYGYEIGTDEYVKHDPTVDDDRIENPLGEEYGWHKQSEGDVAAIYDGRGGDYCYLGIVVAATNSTRDGPQSFDGDITIDGDHSVEALMQFGRALERFDIDVQGSPEPHIFTHVT